MIIHLWTLVLCVTFPDVRNYCSLIFVGQVCSQFSWLMDLSLQCLFSFCAVGLSVSSLSGLYTTAMKAAGASTRVFWLLDYTNTMPKSGDKSPLGLVNIFLSMDAEAI